MNFNIAKFGICVILASIILFSCNNSKQKTAVSPRSEVNLQFDSLKFSDKVYLVEKNDTTVPYSQVDIKFVYPTQFKSESDLQKLQKMFVETFFDDTLTAQPQDALKKYVEKYTGEYRKLASGYLKDAPYKEKPHWFWNSLSKSNQILFQNDSIISYAIVYSEYTGGAHGSYNIVYRNIDLTNIKRITEEDLFVLNYKKSLSDIIVRKIMKNYNITSTDSLLANGFLIKKEGIVPNNNFWINKEGLHYTYNQYEIACYAMGPVEVFIPYSELKAILKPNSIVEQLFKTK